MSSSRGQHPRVRVPRTTLHDVREEPVGTFAGTLERQAPVGTYGNVRRFRRQGAGIFAGDADHKRKGSFADASA